MGLRTTKHSSFFKNTVYEKWQKKVSPNPLFMGKTHIFLNCVLKRKICNQNQ